MSFAKRALVLVAGVLALIGGVALATLPPGQEISQLVVQNAGNSAADVMVQNFQASGDLLDDTQNVTAIAPGGSRILPGRVNPTSHSSPSSRQPLASLLVREITTTGTSDNHSYSIVTVRNEGAPSVAMPILLSDFSSERWTSRFTVLNVGTELACIRVSYFIAASMSSVPVGQEVLDHPTGQAGCATGYPLWPNSQLMFGDTPTASYSYPAGVLATQSAGLIEVINAGANNGIVAAVDIYRGDGNRLLGSYDGFAVRPSAPASDDVGTEVVMPLAIKHISGYYSVIGVQNLGSSTADVNIRYLGSTEAGVPVDVTVTLPSVANVGFHSTYDESIPIPIDFVGYAVVTSPQPVAAVLIRGKQTWYLSGLNEPTYTAVNGVPRDRGETEWSLPLIYRRVQRLSQDHIGWNSWIQVQVADGSTANVTLRFVGTPGTGCPEGPFVTTVPVAGSKVFYMNADTDNGFPAGQAPRCFLGAATVSSSRPLIVIANVSSDSYAGGDNEAMYNGVPASGYTKPLAGGRPSGTITIGATLFESWDPHFSDFAQDIAHFFKVWRGMYELDLDNKPVASMAAAAPTVSTDGKTYTIKLKPGLKWSDGQPLEAQDFVMGIQRTCDFANAGHYQYILTAIVGCDAAYDAKNKDKSPAEIDKIRKAVGVKAIDATTVEIKLTQPQPTFPIILALWPTFPVPKHVVKTVDAKWPGPLDVPYNGPFKVSKYTEKSSMELVPNENWAGTEKAKVEKIVMKYNYDLEVLNNAYRAGEIDATIANKPQLDILKIELAKELALYPATRTIGLEFQLKDPLMAKDDVRVALSRATDRATMMKVVFKDANTATTSWVPPSRNGLKGGEYDSILGFDPAKAKEALAKAGYPNGQGFPGVTILQTDTATNKLAGEFLQAEWKKHLGIEVKLEFTDSRTRSSRFNSGDFQIVLGGWQEDYPDPENWFLGLWETGGSINKTNTSIEALDDQIAKAKFNMNDEQRRQLYRDAEKTLLDRASGIAPLYHTLAAFLVKPTIKGMVESKRPGDTFVPGDWNPELWSTTKK